MGSIVRRGTKTKPRFYLKYRDADGRQRMKCAKGARTVGEARELLTEIERRVFKGELGVPEPSPEEKDRRRVTVKQLGEDFCKRYTNPKVKDIEEYRRHAEGRLARVYKRIGSRAVASLDVADLERLRDELIAERDKEEKPVLQPASVTQVLAILSKMFAWAQKQKILVGANPMRGCARPGASPISDYDFLSKDEVAALLAHALEVAPDVHPAIAVSVYAGLRKGELLGLRWTDIDLDAKRLDVRRSYATAPKSGKARFVPLNAELLPILRAWRDRKITVDENLVFPVFDEGAWRTGNAYDMLGLPELLKGAGCHVPAKPWHSLRHTFASHFMMAGGNILTLQKLLGHSTLVMTLRYAHLARDFVAVEVNRMSFAERIAGITPIEEARAAT